MSGKKKVCLVASIGGHLQELLQLRPAYGALEHFYIVNERFDLPDCMRDRTHFIRHSERDLLTIWNFWEAWRILRRERPTHLLSTGAGLAVPIAIVGRLMGVRVLYIESFCAMRRPTLTGRIMYWLAHHFLYQWEQLEAFFPGGVFAGKVFDLCNAGHGHTTV